ncbi:MAG: hypothetical protein DBX39_01135 [Bacillota bacterium]|nr:MAG: hypothetical protein DBX39_01135 [Bacillota bacterium]
MKLFVGFDMQNSNIRIMNAEKATDKAEVEYLHFSTCIFSDEFFEEAQKLLEEYFQRKPSLRNLSAFVILPDRAVGFETFNLPNMAKSKSQQALETEMNNLYEGRHRGKKINQFVLLQNKQYTIYGAIYFDKKLINKIYKLLTEVKVFPKMTTYSGNALLDCALNFAPRLRGKSFVFADMHADYTEIVVAGKGKTQGVATIPHGSALLRSDKVESEYMQTDHQMGEIAVINAREIARAKALTQSVDADPSVIPEGATIADYAVDNESQAGEYSGTVQAETAAASADAKDRLAVSADSLNEEDRDEQDDDISEEGGLSVEEVDEGRLADGAAEAVAQETDGVSGSQENAEENGEGNIFKPKKIKVYRKMPKRYPKFMMREIPETEQGIRYENFRIIMKWILLYARQAELTEYMIKPDFVVVNMPAELYPLLEQANAEQKESEGIEFRPFSASEKFVPEIKENLDLFGCLFAGHYNKHHNF